MSVASLLNQEKQLEHLIKRIRKVQEGTAPKIERLLTKGDLCDLYLCSWEESPEPVEGHTPRSRWEIIGDNDGSGNSKKQAVLKVCRNSGDADLVQNEIHILDLLYPQEQKEEGFYRYLCKPLGGDTKAFSQPTLILPYLEGYLSLEDVLKAYPEGIDYQDMAWMFKRLLVAVGFAHSTGQRVREIIHGAVVPPHFMVHPTEHGGKLIDWSYAVPVADRASIKAISATWRDYYPPEVFAKRIPDSRTDVYMAAKCALALVGGDVKTNEMPDKVPEQIQTFLLSCLGESPSSRPRSAWDLHDKFDEVLRGLIGKPRYRPFSLPV